MSDITNEWRELRSKLGDLICHIDGMNESIESKMKKLQEKEEYQADLQAQIDEAYNKGLQDLYNAIYTLMMPSIRLCHLKIPSMPVSEMRKIFGTTYLDTIIVDNTPEEIIDKVNQWKANTEREGQEFHVGDEVTTDDGMIGIVTIVNDKIVWILYNLTASVLGFDSSWFYKDQCKKTGRHFDSIPFDYHPEIAKDKRAKTLEQYYMDKGENE